MRCTMQQSPVPNGGQPRGSMRCSNLSPNGECFKNVQELRPNYANAKIKQFIVSRFKLSVIRMSHFFAA